MPKDIVLEMQNVSKRFGSVIALDDVNLSIQKGEVHGLLGGNGAGKTTLMNVLYGLYQSDAGQVRLGGEPISVHSPKDAINSGIGMVHQRFLQINRFTVTENIVLGTDLQNWPRLNLDTAKEKINELGERFGLPVDPDAILSDLPMGVRQRVEILKALYRGVQVLVLDEPTTNLTPQEVDALFESLRVMVDDGLSVIFITHKLREVLEVCDRITVLRHGKNVLTMEREDASEEAFVTAMVGSDLDVESSIIFSSEQLEKTIGDVGQDTILEVADLTVGEGELVGVKSCSLTLHAGEILGVAGVSGNGQLELIEGILGLRPVHGSVLMQGTDVSTLETHEILKNSVAYVPEDRWQDGFLPTANVAQNLILGLHRQAPYSDGRLLQRHTILDRSNQLIEEFNIKTPGAQDTAGNLSGGNIQRVMLARAFSLPVDLLLIHNPTRGLDIPSMEFVYKKILERKQEGMATLLISENLDELFLLSNRIMVLCNGEQMGELQRGSYDKYAVGRMMSGVRQSE
ncbi:MAG: ABC transporter ATP-binding protein [Chloroflexi bacterium]|nr:MAG: ABC transporter ATP-binding protein [Chloroflexota bacterium]MBL1196284.1 ABC transporter ATP-binding protein [Chloroflexota bacterium]NOH13579.1 ABC transporter ATP-binding protein [Chloroflexota bacterium]